MAYDLKGALIQLKSHLLAGGLFPGGVGIGEPFTPPDSPYASLIVGPEWSIPETTLVSPVELRQITIRIYGNRAIQEPTEENEFRISNIISELMEDIWTDFTFNEANVRVVRPTEMSVRFGYQEIGRAAGGTGIMFRIADMIVPLRIDDSFTFAP